MCTNPLRTSTRPPAVSRTAVADKNLATPKTFGLYFSLFLIRTTNSTELKSDSHCWCKSCCLPALTELLCPQHFYCAAPKMQRDTGDISLRLLGNRSFSRLCSKWPHPYLTAADEAASMSRLKHTAGDLSLFMVAVESQQVHTLFFFLSFVQ